MRASVVSLSRRLLSAVFAVMLGVGLVPAPAIAENGSAADAARLDAAANATTSDVMGGLIEGSAVGNSFNGKGVDGSDADASVGGIINEDMPLDPVVQAESTRSYFLAQTLESTRGVPMVSAKLPVGGDAADEVVGSFTYRGITYAVEPGGESVCVVAADPAKLPTDFLDARTIVLPSATSPDGIDSYSVTRIAEGAFSSMSAASAMHDGKGADAQARTEAHVSEDGADPNAADKESSDPSSEVSAGHGLGVADGPCSNAEDDAEGIGEEQVLSGPSADDGAADAAGSDPLGITAITVPSSVTSIEEGAFSGFETLQYVIVSSDNPNYSMYDGCLYDKPMTSLLLIPEGRLGAVRIAPSVTNVDPEVFSHCPLVDTIVADANSAAVTSENGFLYNVELSGLVYPVAVVLMDGGAVVAATPGFVETIEPVDAIFDETKVSDLILAEQSDALADQGEVDRPTEENIVPESQDGAPIGTDRAVFEDARTIAADHASHGGALPCSWTDASGTFHEIAAADVAVGRGDASRAGWSFDPGSGKVSVWSAIGVTVTNLWAANSYEFAADRPTLDTLYWGPLRSRIVSVDTSQLSGATDMGCWFTGCTSLSDISAFRIPDGSRGGSVPSSLYSLFNVFTSTEDDLTNLITELPPTFYLPEGVTNLHVAFGGCQNLETVYEGFAFPSTLAIGGFEGCISLKYVPGSLFSRLTDSSSLSASHMFARCRSITTLGDGFFIPDQVINAYNMFIDCDSLAYIPASLDMRALGTKDAHTMFADAQADALSPVPYSPLKTTYFAGSAEQLRNLLPDARTSLPEGVTADQVDTPEKYWELVYGRKLVTTGSTVQLHTRPKGATSWPAAPWQTVFAADGSLSDPGSPRGNSYGFSGWHLDPDLSGSPVSFPLAVSGASHLYSEYLSLSGALPCSWTDASGTFHEIAAADVAVGRGDASRAGWSFDPGSGKVSVWSAIGVTVTNLWAANSYEFAADRPTLDTLYWGPLRSRIVSVDTSQLSGATDMGCWFTGCTSLSDISAFRIPDGSRGGSVPSSLYSLFNVFTSTEDDLTNLITELPPTFYLPEGVTNLHVAFGGCQNLETVYEGFAFPSTLAIGGFEGCISLKYVPGSLFSRLTDSSSLSASHMFARCRSITTLGDGFFIPDQVINAYNMFIDCDSLAYIPASLDMRALGTKDAHTMFADAQADALSPVPYSPLKTTYFAGSAEQLRNLLPDARTSLPEGVTADQVDTPEKYWELVYGRKLVLLNPTGDDDNVVVFIEKRMDDGIGWDVLEPQKKVDGKIDVPSTENYYGYLLSWYADPLRTVSVPVESGKLLVGDSNKVYGLLTLVISMDMPIPSGDGERHNTVSLSIDTTTNKVTVAGSEDEAAPVRIRSFTPVETRLSVSTKQEAAQLELADVLFDGRPTSVLVSISIGDAVYKLRLSGATYANVAKIAKATSDTDAGTVDGALTLEIPRSVNVVPLDEPVDSVDLTSVVWTVAA